MFILKFLIIFFIKFYRLFLSPLFGSNCRFHPTCSSYALEALKSHGLIYGGYLTLIRLLKCNPFGSFGNDPVPPHKKKIRAKFLDFLFRGLNG